MSKESSTEPPSTESTPTEPVSSEPPRDLADARVEQLTEVGLLTEREAQAYVLRDVYSMCREYTADRLGVSTSRVDNALRSARQRLQNARETVALTKDWATNQEYPRQLDRIDNEHVDGFDPVNIETIIEAVTRTVDPDVMVDAPDPVNYDSDEEFHAAEAKHLAAIDAAVWRAIEDKSQRELYTAVHQSGEKNTEEAAELLAPRWLPMSEKAFAATRDYFSTFADPKAHFDHSGQPQMSD